jgi:single-strand DNA-binding protein
MSTSVTVIGNLTRDPEVHFADSGKAVVSFSIAVNKSKKTETGWEQLEPEFYDCVTFTEQAENFANSFSKGQRVIAIGRLQNRSWDDKETGEKRRKIELVADEIGASIRWATVAVTKNERSDSGDSFNRKDAPRSNPNPNRKPSFEDYNSEPF